MKLNAEIICDRLRETGPVDLDGPINQAMELNRPEFLLQDTHALEAGRLYLVKADHLPRRLRVEAGAVLVCLGNSMALEYYRERCTVMKVAEGSGLLFLLNRIQKIYDRFDAWNERLEKILNERVSIQSMVEASREIFGNPVFVLDAQFRYLAHAGYDLTGRSADGTPSSDHQGNLKLPELGKFLEHRELSMMETEPLLIQMLDSSSLSVNLFQTGRYAGCLTIEHRLRPHRPGDALLAKFLAEYLVRAMERFANDPMDEKGILRQQLLDVLEGLPVQLDGHKDMETSHRSGTYCCLKLRPSAKSEKLPKGYLCNLLENLFAESFSFEYEGGVVAFINTVSLAGDMRGGLAKSLDLLVQTLDLKVGISDEFSDLLKARQYHQQASVALENGMLFDPAGHRYEFQDFALIDLILNSVGDLPLEAYFPAGLVALVDHDRQSAVSYLNTLSVFLDHCMSITETSEALFIHRSTLMERINRIEARSGLDLKDPDVRLKLQILLKSLKLHDGF